jgi:hypothetical protein
MIVVKISLTVQSSSFVLLILFTKLSGPLLREKRFGDLCLEHFIPQDVSIIRHLSLDERDELSMENPLCNA